MPSWRDNKTLHMVFAEKLNEYCCSKPVWKNLWCSSGRPKFCFFHTQPSTYKRKVSGNMHQLLTSLSAEWSWAGFGTSCWGWRSCGQSALPCSRAAGCWAPAVCSAAKWQAPSSKSTGWRTCSVRRMWGAFERSSGTHLRGMETCRIRASAGFYRRFMCENRKEDQDVGAAVCCRHLALLTNRSISVSESF